MRQRLVAIFGVCLCALAVVGWSEAQPAPGDGTASQAKASEERDRWMAAKLTAAQQILEHLTSGNFEQLEISARRMQVMNFLEQWQRESDFKDKSEYQGQLNAFEFSTKELVRHAGDHNSEGALEAFVAMSQSCVRCHSLIRDGETN